MPVKDSSGTIESVKVRFALIIEKITSAFWVIPGLITVGLIGFFFFIKDYTLVSTNLFIQDIFFLEAEPSAVRTLLGSIATSLMTVLGVMFSIIVVVIEQMSSQYTPRVVSNFTRSTMAQFVLGFYVGTFCFCLILMMNIGATNTQEDPIPRLAVASAAILALVCLMLLVLYIHHITRSIQSTDIIKNIARESIYSIRNVVKDREGSHQESPLRSTGFKFCAILHAHKIGYVESVYWEKITKKVKVKSWEVHFHKAPGDFIQKDMELLSIWSDTPMPENELKDLENIFHLEASRTMSQDPLYGIQKLSDIALKALSPGINDASTAIESIHSITAVLLEFIEHFPVRNRIHLDQNRVIVLQPIELEKIIQNGYDAILKFGHEHEAVKELIRMDLRFIQSRVAQHDLKKHIEWKIQSISMLH